MFDLERFIEECRAAVREDNTHKAAREVVARAVSDPSGVLKGIGEPRRAEVQKLHHAPDLTILNVIWGPGMTVRPVCRLDGEPGFAEVFLDDVFVPDRDVLGGVHQGWEVAMATAGSERGLNLRSILAVLRPHQDHWHCLSDDRPVHVGTQHGAVPHRDRHVGRLRHRARTRARGSRGSRNTCRGTRPTPPRRPTP